MVIMVESNLKVIIYENYGIELVDINILSGGWMNKKFICRDLANTKYVIKIFSSRKVSKMSNNEFSTDYLDNQLLNNLRIENVMYCNNLNCEYIEPDKKNRILLPYGNDRLALIGFLSGHHVLRESINDVQLYYLGRECAKMHYLFRNVDKTPYKGEYLKIPTIDKLFERYEAKVNKKNQNTPKLYYELLIKHQKILTLLSEINIIDEIPISMTHGDFAADNILFEKDMPKILDFELVRFNSPLLDIGRIIMSYCYNNDILNYNRIKSFMSGYNCIIEIKDKDVFLSFITV